ncbi:MAG TPA: AI-2E family transporter [Burkholderiaceae bacterium]|nr:AI-2E family transporter [Burkholderiaceae bacterium]
MSATGSPAPSHLALLALTVIALGVCYLIARPFLSVLAWATALAVVFAPMHERIEQRLRHRWLAAAASVLVVAVLLLAPAAVLVPRLISEAWAGYAAIRAQVETGALERTLREQPWIMPAWEWLRLRIDLGDVFAQVGLLLSAVGSFAVRASMFGTIQLVLVFFLLYYFFRDRDRVLAGLRSVLPLQPAEADRVLRAASEMLYATVFGKVVVAIMQGTLGGLMFWWLGLTAPWFWAVVMGLASLAPIIGPSIVWLPAALILLLSGYWVSALALTLWGVAIVGLIDNLLYPVVVGRYLHIHTALLLLAMIGGLFVFGVVGFFVGPVVLAVTIVLLEIWRERALVAARPPTI